ncbi:hypothetical protein ACEV6Q_26960 [Enterobacter ludwigii]|uniref:hypothetical protein n=1 Tax=Enterobacter ludwigii TaxID=299767 RepID=UPI003BEEC37F
MPVAIFIEVKHTENGIELESSISGHDDGYCPQELSFARAAISTAEGAAKELNRDKSKFTHAIQGENDHVH